MLDLFKKAKEFKISRRAFIGWSSALAATAAVPVTRGLVTKAVEAKSAAEGSDEGKWITAACWHNCGGRCLNKVLVKDGVIVRQKTDDTHPDSPDFPQQRGCARGRAQRYQVFGADRIKYPMKRKHWEPGGGKKELRGKDEWVRISWDEALDIVSSEIKRIKEKYGNEAIFSPVGTEIQRTLSLYGGYVERWGAVSWGTWPEVYPFITGQKGNGATEGNDRYRLRKSKLIILWGANPAQSSLGNPAYNFLQAKKAGTKFIVVDPIYTETAKILADQWIPVRPGTDTALLLGIAYHMIVNNLHDQAFLDKYCVGFDKDHMPEGANPEDNFKDYVLGTYDGTPKTPEWASEICGVETKIIRRFAEEFAATRPTAVISAGAPARINNGEHFPHALMTVTLMTGNVGIPGAGVSPNMHNRSTYAGPSLVKAGSAGVPSIKNPLSHLRLNNCEMWEAILNGEYTDGEGPKKKVDIKMIYHGGGGSNLNQRAGSSKGIEAHRKVEFVVSQNYVFNTDSKYADIVLPATTLWERLGGLLTGNREILIFHSQISEPLYEAKDDIWIATEIGKRLGLDPSVINPLSPEQELFNQLAGAEVIKEDGSGYEKLVAFTAKDIEELGVEGSPQEGRISYQEFKEKGIYQVPRIPGDKLEYTSFEDFIEDPETNRLETPSGKFQIYSQELSDHIRSFGYTKKSPIAKYEPSIEGYEDGQKDGYPYQLITIHYYRRSHSTLDNVPWLREAFPQELRINANDAKRLGISEGDVVKVSSRHGSVIRTAHITETIMPGVVAIGQGAWIEMDEEEEVDKAGCTNILNGDIPTGQGHTGHNTCNVKLEKYNKSLAPDVEWPQRIFF